MVADDMKITQVTLIASLLKLYFNEKLTLNGYKIFRAKKKKGKNVIIYIAPSDFNLIIDKRIVPDKINHLKNILHELGLHPVYLLRESLNSSEAIPLNLLLKSHSIIKTRIQISKLIQLILGRSIKKIFNIFARTKVAIERNLLTDFLANSLERSINVFAPKVILTIGATQELLLVSKRLGVPVVEVMHGVTNDGEIKRMWGGDKKLKPNLVITWHEHYSRILMNNNIETIALGYPSAPIDRSRRREIGKIKILVTLEHSHLESADPYGAFDKRLMKQILTLADEYIDIRFRIHPVIDSDKLNKKNLTRWLNEKFSNPEIHSPRERSLWESLDGIDLHLSKSSSTFFEAALLGIPTVFTDDIYELELPDVVFESGVVIQGGNLEMSDLYEILQRESFNDFRFISKSDFQSLFQQNMMDK